MTKRGTQVVEGRRISAMAYQDNLGAKPMRHLVLAVLVALLLASLATAGGSAPLAYVSTNDGKVVLVDTRSNKPVGAPLLLAATASSAHGIATDPGGGKAYVVYEVRVGMKREGRLSVIEVTDKALGIMRVSEPAPIPVGVSPLGVAVAAITSGNKVYVTSGGVRGTDATVSVVNQLPDNSYAVKTIRAPFAFGVAAAPTGDRVYVTFIGGLNGITVFDTSRDVVTSSFLRNGAQLTGVVVSPKDSKYGKYVFVADLANGQLLAIEADSLETGKPVVRSFAVGSRPYGVAVSADGRYVYVANSGSESVSVVDLTNDSVQSVRVGITPRGVAATLDGSWIYAVNQTDNTVSVISTASLTAKEPIRLGEVVQGPVAFGPFVEQLNSVIPVTIDIRPGSDQNTINMRSQGVVPVAILSSDEFNAAERVDPKSITLGGAPVQLKGNGDAVVTYQDVNGDGKVDLVVHVQTEAISLPPGETTLALDGMTWDETPIHGEDVVRIVGK